MSIQQMFFVLACVIPPMLPMDALPAPRDGGGPSEELRSVHAVAQIHPGACSGGRIVINEILFAPRQGEPEWIELVATGPDTISLTGWSLTDANTDKHYVLGPAPALSAGEYIVLTRSAAQFHLFHPDAGPVLEIPSLPVSLLNNTGDQVVLLNDRQETIDSVGYGPESRVDGCSLERIRADGSSVDPANWVTCPDPAGSTPGSLNGATPRRHDLQLGGVHVRGTGEGSVLFELSVANVGLEQIPMAEVVLYHDINADSATSPDEVRASLIISTVPHPGETSAVSLTWQDPRRGPQRVIFVIHSTEDERPGNDTLLSTVTLPFTRQTVVVNEILYEPRDGCEFVELLNRSGGVVDLSGWTLRTNADTHSSSGKVRIPAGSQIGPGAFAVVASDSSLFRRFPDAATSAGIVVVQRSGLSLGNTGDIILLTDAGGTTIDSLIYSPAWHTPGIEDPTDKSLERIRPDGASSDRRNWGTSSAAEGGTPGFQNSILAEDSETDAALTVHPSPFSPDGDGMEDHLIIAYRLPFDSGSIRVRIFDSRGNILRHLAEGEPAGREGWVIWDGYDDGGRRATIGIYVVLLEAIGAAGGDWVELRTCAVVACPL